MEQLSIPVTHIGKPKAVSKVDRLRQTQKQLEEVLEIVRNDIDRVIQREGRLQNLTARVGEMEARAEQFSRNAVHVRRNIWWRSARVMMSIIAACALFLIGVAVLLVSGKSSDGSA